MLKIVVRTLVILLVAGLISAALYWAVNSGSGSSSLAGLSGRGGQFASGAVAGLGNFDRPGSALSIFSGGLRGRDFRDGGAAQTLALTDILVKIGMIGLLTLVVVGLQRGIARLIKSRKSAKAVGGSS
ncbi:MAG: hypothetical protein P4L50_10815 [Anaerolineaceae bacterium]|nr:hypothetical protein [Anaerolineaceae bacterium]